MRKWLALLGLWCSLGHATASWFTVNGDPDTPGIDTVQVDPVALEAEGDRRVMGVRVNRSRERRNWEGQSYRSYESRVSFDCKASRAHYLVVDYYTQPLWKGEPSLRTDYSNNRRPMLFKDMEPNPTARIIRAACRPDGGRG